MSELFHRPVQILVGLGFPKTIRSPLDAIIYLNDVPEMARTPAHEVALNACKAALMGDIEAETARGAFLAYASKQDILATGDDKFRPTAGPGRHDDHAH